MMRAIYIICLLLCTFCFQAIYASTNAQPRDIINLNNGWKYSQGDYTGAELVGYDDGNWENIGSPFLQHSLLYGERFLCGLRLVPETSATE